MRRRPTFTFPACGIPIDALLTFTGDSTTTVRVSSARTVCGTCTHGDDMSLTSITRQLLPPLLCAVDPTYFWTYQGTLLIVRYHLAYDPTTNLLNPSQIPTDIHE